MQKKETNIEGCFEIILKKQDDARGWFTKTFHESIFQEMNIDMKVTEEYFTYSVKHVFRGLHFQTPPKALDKMVFCASGKVTDYIVDLRKNSSTFGNWISIELSAENPKAIFVPKGLAHGFYVTGNHALMQYKVSETYDVACDTGIDYKGFSFAKDINDPIISERDKTFPSLANFKNPF